MKSVVHKFSLGLALAAVALSGCAKKPIRPDPSATVLGPQGGGNGTLNPEPVATTPDQNLLQSRDALTPDANGQIRNQMGDPVYFDLDGDHIKASERPKLQAAKEFLDKNATLRVLLEGHCDWRGTAEYNLSLGDRRAAESKKYLIALGVSAERIETVSKGNEEAKKNADEATMAKERRVDLVLLKQP